MSNKTKSLLFDLIQISSIVFFLSSGQILAFNLILVSFQVLAILILLVAVWEMRRTKYYRVPDIGKQNELVQGGIYKYIRNPMYLSQLLFFGICVLNTFTIREFVAYLIFLINFIYKIQYEERLLNSNFPSFSKYKSSSWRLIPFIY